MKKSELKTMIRTIVREEVAMAIHEVINELKQPAQSQPSKPIQEKHFSKNKVLNDVLNETANESDWKTLGGGEFTSDRMNELVGRSYGDMMNNNDSAVTVDGQQPEFLKKDYRELLKKSQEKSNMKRG
tara:strand:+ start:1297 stop:1680 length:384 start_codon:yes stop_codon:yes gene_type:complete